MFPNKRSQSEFLPTLFKHKTSESEDSSSSAGDESAATVSIFISFRQRLQGAEAVLFYMVLRGAAASGLRATGRNRKPLGSVSK